jgi:branched-chain amino acid transport system ATP-binding protein
MLLEVSGLSVRYGHAQVLNDVSLEVAEGETVTLIGANGAGKTSCLRAISGLTPQAGGTIRFNGEAIEGLTLASAWNAGWCTCPRASGCSRGCRCGKTSAWAPFAAPTRTGSSGISRR